MLLRAAQEAPGQTIVHVRGDGGEHIVTFAELRDDALRVAGGLIAAGVAPGTPVPLVADLGEDFQPMFWGALAAGLTPVPLAPDARRVEAVWELLGRPPVVVDGRTEPLVTAVHGEIHTVTLDALREGRAPSRLPRPAPQDIAFLQFSSGSTGTPKGVELTHAGILANLRQIQVAAALTPDDVLAGWMPYFHDMGLIGTHLVPMATRLKQVRLEPLSFAKRPTLWFEAVARHRATVLSAANFALALVVRRVPRTALTGLDLGCVRVMLVGAEPIAPRVWREFAALTASAGLDARAPLPVYGLAEATLAVTVPPLGEIAAPHVLDRAALGRGRAVATEPGPHAVELMDLGHPVEGCEIRVTDGSGRILADRSVGHVEVSGPQLGRGYHRAPEASAATFADGRLRTGDLGFLADGRLCVTGRHKDVVFVNGRTFHAPDLEETVAATPGLPGDTVAVIGSTDPVTGGERVVAFVQWARPPMATAAPVLRAAAFRVREALGHDDVRILPLPPGAFPRTTSGKLRRGVLRTRFEAGAYAAVEARVAGTVPTARSGPAADGGTPDRPTHEARPAHGPTTAPRTARDVQRSVLGVWARVLDRSEAEIGPHERFFDLGGSSLKAMTVLAGLEDTFGVTLEPRDLRDHDTVAALTGHILSLPTGGGAGNEEGRRSDGPGDALGPDGRSTEPARLVGDAPDVPLPGEADGPPPHAGTAPGTNRTTEARAAVAVLATACRFPGAETPEAFWELLAAGGDTVGPAPEDRRTGEDRVAGVPGERTRHGSYLADPGAFDAEFFGMDDTEARATDPQARIFLELAHEALERAGYAGPRRTGRRIGVFAATGESGYREILTESADGDLARHPAALTGNLPNLIAARVSQILDLNGPALAVDTACSSALVALHLARRSLLAGECDLAVVGGVNLGLTPTGHRLLEQTGALSPTGVCRAFGAGADGFVPGEGGAALVLARLDDARRADDPVLALVRGTAVNNDGRSLSLMAPSPRGQREVIARAYRDCGVDESAVSYVEAHGTGTPIGDPVEAQSLGHAFPPRADGSPRLLGSVKANLGHLLNAAGMPALLKVVLALGHRQLPPSPHSAPPAPYLQRVAPGFRLVTEHQEWHAPKGPLVAGVNAFGFGGTNAHAVLEEPPGGARPTAPATAPGAPSARTAGSQPAATTTEDAAPPPVSTGGPHLLTLSAATEDALIRAATELAAHVRARPDLDEGDVCAGVNTARDDGRHRLALVVDGDLANRLEAAREQGETVVRRRPRTVFLLPGQGAQRPGQGRALYRSAPVFREVLDEASSLTGPVRGRTLAAWCLDETADPAALARTEVAQPLLVAFGVGLARQLAAWGVRADAVVGHSVGEITAACVSGTLTLAEAVGFAAERGRLVGRLAAPGAMAAVRCAEDVVTDLVAASGGTLCVAAVNGPAQVVLAGEPDAVDRAVAELTARGVAARRLHVSHAFHSPMLDPVLRPLGDAAKALTVHPADLPMLSTVTGRWGPDLTPGYWGEHAVRPVRFGAAVARLLDEGFDTFVELGPGDTLCGPVRAVAAAPDEGAFAHGATAGDVAVLPALGPSSREDGREAGAPALLETVGRLWTRGSSLVRDGEVRGGGARRRVPVPTYPFRRSHHWPRLPDTAAVTGPGQARPSTSPRVPDPECGPTPSAVPASLPGPYPAGGPASPVGAEPGAGAAPGHVDAPASPISPVSESRNSPVSASGAVPVDTPGAAVPRRLVWRDAPLIAEPGPAVVRLAGADTELAGALAARLAVRGVRVLTRHDPPRSATPHAVVWLAEDGVGGADPRLSGESRSPGSATRTAISSLREMLPLLGPDCARLLVVTADVHVTGTGPETPRPAQALLHGFALALPDEHPGLSCRSVDLSSRDLLDSRVDAVERELYARIPSREGGAVAWRAGRRLTRTAVAVSDTGTAATAMAPNGTHLITGGAGGLGSALALDLAERGTPELVLVGRTAMPPRNLLAELRARGARAQYHAVDVSDEAAVDFLIAGLPALDGVFHTAGTAVPGSLRGKSDEEVREVLAAKVDGTVLLAEALRRHGHAPAVCVAFSSVSAVLPGLAGALGDYAAANAFLDAFAAAERAAGRPWQAIGLGPVADTGLASGARALARLRAHGLAPMSARAALAGLRTAVGVDAAQVTVTGRAETPPPGTGDPGEAADRDGGHGPTGPAVATDAGRPAPPKGTQEHQGHLPAGTSGPDSAHIADLVRRLLAEAVHRAPEDVGDDDQFLTLGLDSLTAVDLARRLERELGESLPATLLFEYRTIGELAAHLAEPSVTDKNGPTAVPSQAHDSDPKGSGDSEGGRGGGRGADGRTIPLTPVQLAFHTTETLHEGSTAYAYVRQTVSGPLDDELLGLALAHLAARHPMLRMRLTRDDIRPGQYVVPAEPVDSGPRWYEVRDLWRATTPAQDQHLDRPSDHGSGQGSNRDLDRLELDLCNRPFDLTVEDPVRAVLVREKRDLAHLLLAVHHSGADGYSLKVLGEDLWTLYTALTLGTEIPELPSPRAEFTDYAAAVTAERRSASYARDRDYWRERLAGHSAATTAPALPYDGDPEAPPAPPLTHHRTGVDEALTTALREIAAQHDVSLFHLLLAVYGRCLARWTGRRSVAVNVARARREMPLAGIERLVGPLADTLPVFVTVDLDEPVTVLARRLRRIWREAEAHSTLSSPDFARLLPAGGPVPRTAAEAGFSFARFPVLHGSDRPVTVTPTAAATASAATRLGLLCWEADASLRLSWNYPERLFRPETVRQLANLFADELRAAVSAQSTASLRTTAPALPLRPEHAAHPSRPESASSAGTGNGIVDRLCARFRATPEAVAVDTGRTTLTYAALDRASAALADRLRAHGVQAGDLVGLLTEPGADTVTGVVGILRSGAGWVPMDATHPAARHRDQLSRTGVRVLVFDETNRTAAAELGGGGVGAGLELGLGLVETGGPMSAARPPAREPGPDDIAYVIFTSGSTGRPKAVPVTHRSMANYLAWSVDTFGYGPEDRLVQTASVCFDASVRQLLAPLLVGATVHTLTRDLLRDPEALLDRLVDDRITVWSSVPTLWERLLTAAEHRAREDGRAPDLSALRWVHVGGEALPAEHVRRWFDLLEAVPPGAGAGAVAGSGNGPGRRISNLYGPTEATINATCHIIDSRPADDVRHLPIGLPVAGTGLTVVDEDENPCGPGVAGELLISGTGLTPGYLGDPELTAAAFTEREGRRWYRSGDRVRRRADGVLEFLGRLDDQVKVRGHRVELGEVEAALSTHPGVARAAVLLREGRLVAYVEIRDGAGEADPREVRGFLSRVLPPYMLPTRIHSVASLPLTGSGKIDRNRLAREDEPASGGRMTRTRTSGGDGPDHAASPATPTERVVRRVWSQLLDAPEVFPEDDFFALGGDSIMVLELFARLRAELPVLPRPTAVYTHRTVSALAAAIDAAAAADAGDVRSGSADAEPGPGPGPEPEPGPGQVAGPSGPFPLTPSQRGFLLAEALAPGAGSGWLARFRLSGPVRGEVFQQAVDVLLARHPMLRTVFPAGARPPVQQELPDSLRLPVETETLVDPDLLEQRVAEEARRRFEPWAWPLLRLRLFTVGTDEHVLLVHAHHLIGDGYSAALFARELLTVYERLGRGLPDGLPPLHSTFQDHVALRTGRPPTADPYTERYLTRHQVPYTAPVLRSPGVDQTGAPTGFRTTSLTLGGGQTRALRRLASESGCTLYAPLLTAYYRALTELTGRRDLVLGLAVTGREDSVRDAHRVFGPFAEAVEVRPALPDESRTPAFGEDLRRIADETVAARTAGPMDLRSAQGLPRTGQFFFTFLDFTSLGAPPGGTLVLRTDDADTALAPPPVGTDVFLSVRPAADGEGLRVTVRTSAAALADDELARFAAEMSRQLADAVRTAPPGAASAAAAPEATAPAETAPPETARTSSSEAAYESAYGTPRPTGGRTRRAEPGRGRSARSASGTGLDAALVGYLPAPHQLAAFASLPRHETPEREEIRALLFPDGRATLLEETDTPLGRSGFVSLPLFADELAAAGDLSVRTARAVEHAASLGARCVSLAGMIPSLTGYGYDVLRESPASPTAITTGHAATTVAVVKTVHAALAATGRDLAERTLAVIGCGSIGTSSLRLLLARSPRPPARLFLCDLPGSGPRLRALAGDLSADCPGTRTEVLESGRDLPVEVYEADLIVTAVSGATALLDIDRLRPGTIVVDDSFPHCFDTSRALDRMREQRDVLVVGGGLLALDHTETRLPAGLPAAALAGHAVRSRLPGTLASCRLESLLHAHLTDPGRPSPPRVELPLIHGLVDLPRAFAHWDAADAAGVRPAPLHLLDHVVTAAALDALPPPR
ncbi:amino acid adenylation domain-containing protein [Streptomyces sp. NPDC060006]|uniref:amino acid adenylation domain-containing protein n=1 Tax=unclassified Streptomyces TaxID=2593676 RepID=UPI0036A10092